MWWILLICHMPFCYCQDIYLFGLNSSGFLEAVEINLLGEDDGNLLSLPSKFSNLSDVRHISRDEENGVLLFQRREYGELLTTELCRKGPSFQRQLFSTSYPVYLEDTNHGICWNCQVSSFHFVANRLYFMAIGGFESNLTKKKMLAAQLRVFSDRKNRDCEERRQNEANFSNMNPFLLNCSLVIAEILLTENTETRIEASETLFITRIGNELSFFVQLFERNPAHFDSFHLHLYHVTELGTVQKLHRETIPQPFHHFTTMKACGVHYKKDRLCWIAIDRIYCGHFSEDFQLREVRLFLYSTEMNTRHICVGTYPIITGLAIALITPRNTIVLFSCRARSSAIHSVMLMKISNSWNGYKLLYPIKIGGNLLDLHNIFTLAGNRANGPSENLESCFKRGDILRSPKLDYFDSELNAVLKDSTRGGSKVELIAGELKSHYVDVENIEEISVIDYDPSVIRALVEQTHFDFLQSGSSCNGIQYYVWPGLILITSVHLLYVKLCVN